MVSPFPDTIRKLDAKQDLSADEISRAVEFLTDTGAGSEQKMHFLQALHDKGETPEEIAAFARAFRDRAKSPGDAVLEMAVEAIDIVGTGGDRSGAFNISTTVSFILASGGVRVIKHGNRGATSKTGSADMLESLGIPLEADPALLEASLENLNFCFLFARAYHPAFKSIAPVRAELAKKGLRTVFNLLGPLINPARPRYQVMGVYAEHLVEPIAGALGNLGVHRGLVVHGRNSDGGSLDKFTTAGQNHVCGVGELEDIVTNWEPSDFDLAHCSREDLMGGDARDNLAILDAFLEGRANRGLTDAILLNAGAGFWVMRRAPSLKEGVQLARRLVDDGTVKRWVAEARKFYREHASHSGSNS